LGSCLMDMAKMVWNLKPPWHFFLVKTTKTLLNFGIA
jgi:hypothetical protein